MTQIQVGSELNYDVRSRTTFLFKIAAAMTPHQNLLHEELMFDPGLDVEHCQVGSEGNRMARVVVEPCQLRVNYRATVDVTPEFERPQDICESTVAQMPPAVLSYMNPSRYCESDVLAKFAFDEFGGRDQGFSRVQSICDWVFDHLEYTPGSTGPTTTAADVLLQRVGVCRDFAHLAVALCRGVGIPARYVSGYAVDLEPPDYHGFMEAFLDGHWYMFDPTRLASTRGLVRIGVGRDAADVAFATIIGSATMTQKSVHASFSQSAPDHGQNQAVSTA